VANSYCRSVLRGAIAWRGPIISAPWTAFAATVSGAANLQSGKIDCTIS
jgi:succinylarginine dihydrolase